MKKQASFLLLHSDTHFLMIQRRGGELGFPGGKQEGNESIVTTALREFAEELSAQVFVDDLREISVEETSKFECHLLMGKEIPHESLMAIVANHHNAQDHKSVDGVLLLKKKPSTIGNLIKMFPLAPTVKEELEVLKDILEGK